MEDAQRLLGARDRSETASSAIILRRVSAKFSHKSTVPKKGFSFPYLSHFVCVCVCVYVCIAFHCVCMNLHDTCVT